MADMSYEMNSDAVAWIDLGGADRSIHQPLKLSVSDVARLYRMCGDVLRKYSDHSSDVLMALGDEAELHTDGDARRVRVQLSDVLTAAGGGR